MNGSSPPGGSSTAGGSGSGGNMGEGTPNRPPGWPGLNPDILRPSFYHPGSSAFGHFGPGSADSRFLQPHLTGSNVPPTTSVPQLFHHHGHPTASALLPSPWSMSPAGYAHAAAAAAFGSRPPYLDPAFLAGSLPRYRYLLPSSPSGGRFPGHLGPSGLTQPPAGPSERSHSESEGGQQPRWRRPLSPKPLPPQSSSTTSNPPLLPLIPEHPSVRFRPHHLDPTSSSSTSDLRLPSPDTPHSRAVAAAAAAAAASSGLRAPSLPTQPYYPSHFMRGTIIQLASGDLKRVEELNTEDFVRSANLSSHLKMDSSTVVRIEEKTKDTVLLCFSVGENKVQVSVEATVEHPFFVIGQGWSSCSPERTRTLYGLPCQRLQVGDICISLTHRDMSGRSGALRSSPTATSSSATVASRRREGGRLSSGIPPKRTRREESGRRSLPPIPVTSRPLVALRLSRRRRWSWPT